MLRILLLSDLHKNVPLLADLATYLDQHNEQVDVIFYGGDYLSLSLAEQEDSAKIDHAFELINDVNRRLMDICSVMYFVPGNVWILSFTHKLQHDPLPLFSPPCGRISFGTNVHNQDVEVADGLHLIGLGGSPPGFLESTMEKRWEGIPYSTLAECDEAVRGLQDSIQFEENCQYMLLSHFGPNQSNTSLFHFASDTIICGSDALDGMMSDTRDRGLFMCMHGHCHRGLGRVQYSNVQTVVNPGAFVESGKFCLIDLEKDGKGKWTIVRTNFVRLNPNPTPKKGFF